MRGIRLIGLLMGLIVLLAAGVFLYGKFEGEEPSLSLSPEPGWVGKRTTFALSAMDRRSGLKEIKVEIAQGDRAVSIFHELYPKGTHAVQEALEISPLQLGLKDEEALLRAEVRDRSWRRGGNPRVLEAVVSIDTRPPQVSVLSRFHYVKQGGAGVVIYRSSEGLAENAVLVGDLRFPGYPLGEKGYLALFAVPYDAPADTPVTLEAKDPAGNQVRVSFPYRIKPARFRKDVVEVKESFLQGIMPYFAARDPSLGALDGIEAFLRVNRDLRRANEELIRQLCQETSPRPLWSGPFLRMAGSKTMARFADHRVYLHAGKEIDRQVHLGVDLASLAMNPVEAANRGRVAYAGELGIYGNTVLLDHGCGLFSMYSHLSRIDVQPGQEVDRRAILGQTGRTGLAGGDHLHFGILVSGVFVNPLEWWDPHWMEDNVTAKISLLRPSGG